MRDMLLGRPPRDFDVASGLGTDALMQVFGTKARALQNPVGTVSVTAHVPHSIGHWNVEVTPLRNWRTEDCTRENLWDTNLCRCCLLLPPTFLLLLLECTVTTAIARLHVVHCAF